MIEAGEMVEEMVEEMEVEEKMGMREMTQICREEVKDEEFLFD